MQHSKIVVSGVEVWSGINPSVLVTSILPFTKQYGELRKIHYVWYQSYDKKYYLVANTEPNRIHPNNHLDQLKSTGYLLFLKMPGGLWIYISPAATGEERIKEYFQTLEEFEPLPEIAGKRLFNSQTKETDLIYLHRLPKTLYTPIYR